MKNALLISLSMIALAAANPCEAGIAGFLTKQHRDWDFIQSVGGMKVHVTKNFLVVSCDVSGTKTITTKPTTIHSGIGVRQLKCSRAGSTLRLSVVTSVLEKGMKSSCGSVDLSAHPAGSYAVVYLNPNGTTHSLGTIDLP